VDAIAFVRVRCSKALRARFDATLRNIRCICIRVSRMKKSDSKCETLLSLSPSERDDTAFCIIAKKHIFSSADVLLTHDYGLYLHSILNSIAHIIGQCLTGRSLSSPLRYRYRYSLARFE